MFAAGGRLTARVAAALAQRRRYVVVVLRGSAGTQKASFKLTVPWAKSVAPKPLGDTSSPILRVLKHGDGGVIGEKDESRATLKIIEHNAIVASSEMWPAIEPWDDQVPGDEDSSDEEGGDEGEEPWGHDGDELWSGEGEEMSEDEFEERIPGLENKLSDEEAMVQFLRTLKLTSDDEHGESIKPDVKRSLRRVPSSFAIDLCLWLDHAVANATIHRTDDRGDCIWQSTSCFKLDEYHSIDEELRESQSVKPQITAFSPYSDGRLMYTGYISDQVLDKFRVSFETHYTMDKLLGRGGEADVYECTDLKHSKKCAVKLNNFLHPLYEEPSEPRIMKELSHPNIRKLFCAWSEEKEDTYHEQGSVFLAQEICKCTLEDLLDGSFLKTIEEKAMIFYDAVSGLNYMHIKGYVHRDIKTNNIFIDYDGHAKIGDFGQSDFICSSSCSDGGEFFGSLLFSSPEILGKKQHDQKTDVYSLGLVYFELFGPPANTLERDKRLRKFKRLMGTRKWKADPVLAWEESELRSGWDGNTSLMVQMLKMSPRDRPSCADILVVLPDTK